MHHPQVHVALKWGSNAEEFPQHLGGRVDMCFSEDAEGLPRTHSPSDASNEKNGKKAYQEKQGQ